MEVNLIFLKGDCNSCWAFGTIVAMEGGYAIRHGKLLNLSEQQIVNCAGKAKDKDCSGVRFLTQGFDYVKKIGNFIKHIFILL